MTLVVHSARLIAETAEGRVEDLPDAWVRIEGGRVAARGTGEAWRMVAAGGDRIVDAARTVGEGALVTPGLVDIHVHGGGGASYDEDDDDALEQALATHAAHGTTRSVLSLVSGSPADTERRVARIARLAASTAGVLGSHLEGPFLDHDHRGAHDPRQLRVPDAAELERLLTAGAGTVRQVTIAPEHPGALDAIRRIVDAGAAAAVGHTGADERMTRAAFDAGATILTHAFNAMPGLHHRAPGPVGAAASDDRVTLEVIADGVHLDPTVVALLFRLAPGRVALITDAMAAAGVGDGTWMLGSQPVEVREGVARLSGSETIAGSTLTQDRALRVAVASGVPLADAVAALTSVPARAVGHPELGLLDAGSPADLVLWDRDLAARAVWRAGEPLPGAGAP